MYEPLAVLAVLALLYGIFAGAIQRTSISGPMIFMGFGLLVGPSGLGLLDLPISGEIIKSLAELTLALVLFTDASATDLPVLKRYERLPIRLLLVGLPLTIVLGHVVGLALFDHLSVFEVALLATMLAPTDAALGQAVVTNPSVPPPVRESLNVESGLNDGICVPILFLFLAMAGEQASATGWAFGLKLVGSAIGIGAATGLLVTAAAIPVIRLARARGWADSVWIQIATMALALICFATAQLLGGSGFIACFAGGLLFGGRLREQREDLVGAAEGAGDTLSLVTWAVFGGAVVGPTLAAIDLSVVLYAVLSLTVIRMLPVFLTLLGTGVSSEGKLFIGWFGPRGLASIVFAVIVVGAELPHGDLLAHVVALTVLLSIVAHGITANPWARAFGARRHEAESQPPAIGLPPQPK